MDNAKYYTLTKLFERMAELEGLPAPKDPLELLAVGEKVIETLRGHKLWWSEHVGSLNTELGTMVEISQGLKEDNEILKSYLLTCYISGNSQVRNFLKQVAKSFNMEFEDDGIQPNIIIKESRNVQSLLITTS